MLRLKGRYCCAYFSCMCTTGPTTRCWLACFRAATGMQAISQRSWQCLSYCEQQTFWLSMHGNHLVAQVPLDLRHFSMTARSQVSVCIVRDRCPTVSHSACGCRLSPPRRCSQRPSRRCGQLLALDVRQWLARLCGQRPARLCRLQAAQPACHRLATAPTPAARQMPPPPMSRHAFFATAAHGA